MEKQILDESKRILSQYEEMDTELAEAVVKDLTSNIESRYVSRDWAIRVAYSKDSSGSGSVNVEDYRVPDIVVLPGSAEEIAHVCKIASKHQIPVHVMSTNVNTGGMAIALFRGIMIDFKRMNRVIEVDRDGLTITVEPFVSYARAQAALEQHNLRINVPGAPGSASVVGNNLYAGFKFFSGKYGYGAMETVGVEMVLPNGEIVTTGSLVDARMKIEHRKPGVRTDPELDGGRVSVQAWGPDLTGFPHQSVGGNGIVTKMCVKVYKKPDKVKILCHGFTNIENSMRVITEAAEREIGFGGLIGVPEDNALAAQHSNRDVERVEATIKSKLKALITGIKVMTKGRKYKERESYQEVFKGFLALQGIKYVNLLFLMGTKRKVQLDERRFQAILENKEINTEKIRDATDYQKHFFWPHNPDADPESVYILMKNSGMEDYRYDWLIRGGKMLEYNEITARLMRKKGGLLFKSGRVAPSRVQECIDLFATTLEEIYPEAVKEHLWGLMILPGAGPHFACVEFVIQIDPTSQHEKDLTSRALREFTLRALNQGFYFFNHPKLEREMVESETMPKLWSLTKKIREAFDATILAPY
ncbi:MAG: FAD-binding protein [Candidatus Lokiarchaeota archaeon]|nr:FAD-binding protein [Candidatus Lokiarchaeota archaeon]